MKERIEDPSDTLRKRKKMPSSKLNVWRMNNQSKKDQIFNEPLLSGSSDVLRSVFDKDCVASKPHLAAVSDETLPGPAHASSPTREAETEVTVPVSTNQDSTVLQHVQDSAGPQSTHAESITRGAQSPPPFNNDDNGMERLREGGYTDYMPSPPPPRFSPSRTDDFTTQTRFWETESYRTEPSTSTYREDLPGPTNSGVSAIPEMVDEELYFLEVGGNTPVRSPASQDSDGLTGRTRALAQYLKERSSSTPSSSNSSGDLSLGKILDGKTRKVAARMFFETLVLKSRGLIDTQQDQPYSDITLKLMPGLFSKVQP
ncbi:Sister chromatid cohesion 1 protein 3 [Raphanus sativus]|nr:Sister chromatid cohesion 1 protein 3 [Raphanus sativus]